MPSKQTRHFSSIALSSTAQLAAVLMLLLPPSSVVAGVVECYFAANTTHITELPKTLTCSCQDGGGGGGDDSLSLAEDVFGKFSRDLLRNLETVNVQNCQRLHLNLSSIHHDTNNNDDDGETKLGRVDVLVRNVSLLHLDIEDNTRDFVENIRLEQVDRVVTTFLERLAFVVNANATGDTSATTPGPTEAEEMYLLVIYGLCAGLLATLAVVFTLGVCLCRGGCGCCCAGRTKGKRRGHCCLRRSKRVSRAESWRYESNIYVNPRGRQREQPQVKGPGFTASALKASLPYQLVPLSEAAAITQRNSRQVTQPASPQFGEQRPPTASTFAGGGAGYNTHGTNYTDSSLQYADDTDFDDDGAAAQQQQEAVAGSFDQRSTANSGSYGSRNQTSTLPMQQQQLQQQQQQEPNYSRPLQ